MIRPLPAALLVVATLTGCGAGLHDATSGEHSTPYNADANVGAIRVRAVTITLANGSQSSQTPTPAGTTPPVVGAPSIPPGTQAYLSAVLVNDGSTPDILTGATVAGVSVTPTNPSTSPAVDPDETLSFIDPETSGGNVSGGSGVGLAVTGLSSPLVVGTTVAVTFTFQDAGQVTLQVPVSAAAPTATA